MESRIIPRLTEISHQEALRYLGIRGNSSGILPEEQDLSRCETVLRGAVRPRVVLLGYLVADVDGVMSLSVYVRAVDYRRIGVHPSATIGIFGNCKDVAWLQVLLYVTVAIVDLLPFA